jgi:hypothetical protein
MKMKITEGQKRLSKHVEENYMKYINYNDKNLDYDAIVSRDKVLRHLKKLYKELDVSLTDEDLPNMFYAYREYAIAKDRYEILNLKYYLRTAFFSLFEGETSAEDTLEWCMRLFDGTWFRPFIDEMKESKAFPELKIFYDYGRAYVDRTEDWVSYGHLYEYSKMGGRMDAFRQNEFQRVQNDYKNVLEMLADEGGSL